MRNTIKTLTLVLCGILAASTAFAAGALDGRSYQGEIVEQGKTKGDADTFVFDNGRFRSLACDKNGFGDAPYSGDGTRFEATTTSKSKGEMAWKGTVSGNAVEGTVQWSKDGKPKTQYHFKGTLKS